jgi:hypothetical protein
VRERLRFRRHQPLLAVALIKDERAGTRGDNHAEDTGVTGISPQEFEDGAETARFEHRRNVELVKPPGLKIKHARALNLREAGVSS